MDRLKRDGQSLYLWQQAMRTLRARERIALQRDVNAAMNPSEMQKFRLWLGDQAWDADDPEYAAYVSGIAGEVRVTGDV